MLLHQGIQRPFQVLLLVVFCNTLGTARCTGLDLAGVQGNSQVCDGGILGLTGTVGGNCGVACFVSHFDCLKGLRYRTDLVQFDQDGISAAKGDTFCQTLSIGYKQVVTDKLYFRQALRSALSSLPSLLHPEHPRWR